MENLSKRIQQIADYFNVSKPVDFANKTGFSHQVATNYLKGRIPSSEALIKIQQSFENLNPEWLLTGKGSMIRSKETTTSGNLIPLYDDVSTIGGNNEFRANTESVSHPTEYIDVGDWFREATSAIRHYGESMPEYPTGCILALKEVQDINLIVPGRDYVIETTEYRVTKRLQKGQTKEYITAYSTNTETYPDGRQVHEPFDIPFESILRISLVLGYVVKKNGGTMVFNKKK